MSIGKGNNFEKNINQIIKKVDKKDNYKEYYYNESLTQKITIYYDDKNEVTKVKKRFTPLLIGIFIIIGFALISTGYILAPTLLKLINK